MTQALHLQVEAFIKDLVKDDSDNRLNKLDGTPIYDEPVVGFASGSDPLFEDYKKIIGDFHMTPQEFLQKVAAEQGKSMEVQADQCTVICWCLPIVDETRGTMRKETDKASEKWVHTRIYGEQFNNKIREGVSRFLADKGVFAYSPLVTKHFKMLTDVPGGYSSNWSERHALFAAGLGTFGLSEGLITPKGKAMRCGTTIALAKMPATSRPYQKHNEYCLFFRNGKCTECAKRCPAKAISEKGHDKLKCKSFTLDYMSKYTREHYKMEGYGCGLCQTSVPCESCIPVKS